MMDIIFSSIRFLSVAMPLESFINFNDDQLPKTETEPFYTRSLCISCRQSGCCQKSAASRTSALCRIYIRIYCSYTLDILAARNDFP